MKFNSRSNHLNFRRDNKKIRTKKTDHLITRGGV